MKYEISSFIWHRICGYTGPAPMRPWVAFKCGLLGRHGREFHFGWTVHLDTREEGYEGDFICPDCWTILPVAQPAQKQGEPK